ncbi:hypothetical protein AVEN_150059-1 [Araneus ventricosus]|uniref:Uncharacterized protein n=1 Tax=Araneus ventricosus TaxID=182803 RepID=A0A4Y2EVM8_ARAVE|nr:hypothetical protein AVEN_150059-1 [Araneus ventricosus]
MSKKKTVIKRRGKKSNRYRRMSHRTRIPPKKKFGANPNNRPHATSFPIPPGEYAFDTGWRVTAVRYGWSLIPAIDQFAHPPFCQ